MLFRVIYNLMPYWIIIYTFKLLLAKRNYGYNYFSIVNDMGKAIIWIAEKGTLQNDLNKHLANYLYLLLIFIIWKHHFLIGWFLYQWHFTSHTTQIPQMGYSEMDMYRVEICIKIKTWTLTDCRWLISCKLHANLINSMDQKCYNATELLAIIVCSKFWHGANNYYLNKFNKYAVCYIKVRTILIQWLFMLFDTKICGKINKR